MYKLSSLQPCTLGLHEKKFTLGFPKRLGLVVKVISYLHRRKVEGNQWITRGTYKLGRAPLLQLRSSFNNKP